MTEPSPRKACPDAPDEGTGWADDVREIRVRTAPKYVPFLIAGALLGVVTALIVAVAPQDDHYEKSTLFGFFVVIFILAGLAAGGAAALLTDWIGRRRARRAVVEPLQMPDPGPESDDALGLGRPGELGSR